MHAFSFRARSPGADVGGGEPSPGADVGGASPVPVQSRCGRGEPSPGADVAGGLWSRRLLSIANSGGRGRTHKLFISAGSRAKSKSCGATSLPVPYCTSLCVPAYHAARDDCRPESSAPPMGRPHLHRDWAHPSHISTGTGLAPPTSAPGLGSRPCTHACTGLSARHSRCRRGEPSPGADVGGVSPVSVQMWAGRAQSRSRCGR
jgi:hypothetical protein